MDTLLPVLVIVGPTAIGKTAVAIEVARRIDAEIISADSRQIYRWLDIGTAKPTAAELQQARHHFIDLLDPGEEYSAGQFSRAARTCVREIRERGKNVIIAGGSGMYLDSLLFGFFETEVRDKPLQMRLKKRVLLEGAETLYRELQQVDPERAAEIHPADGHRIVRALEVYLSSGKKLSQLRQQPRIPADFPYRIIVLEPEDRTWLYRRIEQRVERMLAAGLIDEVRALLARGVSPRCNAMLTVGYREPLTWLRGEYSFPEMVEKLKQHTRNYAKRQMTWFRRYEGMRVQCGVKTSPEALAAHIVNSYNA